MTTKTNLKGKQPSHPFHGVTINNKDVLLYNLAFFSKMSLPAYL